MNTAIQSAAISAAAATPQTPVTVYLQVGRDMGTVELGTIYYPGQLPDLLHSTAAAIDQQAAADT